MRTEKLWDKSIKLYMGLIDSKYGTVIKKAKEINGTMIGTPVKIKRVDPPVRSNRNRSIPYLNVSIELPSGEVRNINGESLKPGDKKPFDEMKKVLKKFGS